MPRKAKEEVEQELDVNVQTKKKSAAARWFDEYAIDSREDLKTICDLTARSLHDQFTLNVRYDKTEVYGVAFYAIFMELLKFLRNKQKEKYRKQFTVEICNSLNIGYVNNTNDDNEKVGNFMPIMEYIGINRNVVPAEDKVNEKKMIDYLMQWKQINTHQNIEFYKEIQENATRVLMDDYNIDVRTSEMIIPILCIFMDNTVNLLKLKYKDLEGSDVSEVSINVFGLYTVYYSYSEDNGEVIDYAPGIPVKLGLKSDEIASGD